MHLIKFTAAWCGPCKAFGPVFKAFAEKNGLEVREIDIDSDPDMAERYDIRSVPTVVVVEGDNEVKRIVGAKPTNVLARELADYT